MTVPFQRCVTNCLHWYLLSSFGMFGKKCHICCFLRHLFYDQCWKWVIWLEGPLACMGMAVLRCLAWTTTQGKWIQQCHSPSFYAESNHLFDCISAPLRDASTVCCRRNKPKPHILKAFEYVFSLLLWFLWLYSVMNLTSVTFNWTQISKQIQQSSSIICLTHVLKHQSVMVPLRQISAISKFDRNFTSVRRKKNPTKPQPKKLA